LSMTVKLDGQVALVTGGSSGIGASVAQLLASSGARVAVAARRLDRLEKLADRIRQSGGVALPVQLDVANPAAIEPAVAAVEKALGPISILINNAGIYLLKDALTATAEELDQLHAVNVRGSFLVAQAVGRRMIASKTQGRIVNLASIAAFRPMPMLGVYGMSKAAVVHMTRFLAREWGRYGINVCALGPGYFRTEMTENDLKSDAAAKLIERLPRRRVGEVADLATTVLFLVSPGSGFVNGAVIPVDDGLTVA
jgi:NAD(P)-dependent dehydrogenase (short-subunit alcohol dehydrogenase family)